MVGLLHRAVIHLRRHALDKMIGVLARGPLEGLIQYHGPEFIEHIGAESRPSKLIYSEKHPSTTGRIGSKAAASRLAKGFDAIAWRNAQTFRH